MNLSNFVSERLASFRGERIKPESTIKHDVVYSWFLTVVIWGMYKGWPADRIAYLMSVPTEDVERAEAELEADPVRVIKADILGQSTTLFANRLSCELCHRTISENNRDPIAHLIGHAFPDGRFDNRQERWQAPGCQTDNCSLHYRCPYLPDLLVPAMPDRPMPMKAKAVV